MRCGRPRTKRQPSIVLRLGSCPGSTTASHGRSAPVSTNAAEKHNDHPRRALTRCGRTTRRNSTIRSLLAFAGVRGFGLQSFYCVLAATQESQMGVPLKSISHPLGAPSKSAPLSQVSPPPHISPGALDEHVGLTLCGSASHVLFKQPQAIGPVCCDSMAKQCPEARQTNHRALTLLLLDSDPRAGPNYALNVISRIAEAKSSTLVSRAKWLASKNRISAFGTSRLNASAPAGTKKASFFPHIASNGGRCVRRYC